MLKYEIVPRKLREETEKIFSLHYDKNINMGGWGNGYIFLPENHIYYGKDYSEIDEDKAHGGFTYSDSEESFENNVLCYIQKISNKPSFWILGFDTWHGDDTVENWPKEMVEQHAKYLAVYYDKEKFYKKLTIGN